MKLESLNIYPLSKCSDLETEGTFRNHYTGEEFDHRFASTGLDGGKAENCAIVVADWNGWTDWFCKIPKVSIENKTSTTA